MKRFKDSLPDRRHAEEVQVIADLLAHNRLAEKHRDAFEDMQTLYLERGKCLTDRQRAYAFGVADKLGLYRPEGEASTNRNENVDRRKGEAWSNPPEVLRKPLPLKPPPCRRAS